MSINYWRIFCETESDWSYGYLNENQGNPTKCFNDTAHTVNPNSCQNIEVVSNSNVIIQEETTPTGGHFKAVCKKMVCTIGDTTHDFTFASPISALSITLQTTTDHTDDNFEVSVAPESTIGSITANVVASDTVITVSQTVIDNVNVGYYINLDDGTNNDSLGRVTAIDTNALTITTEIGASNGFLAITPTLVKMTVKVVDDFVIGFAGRYELGKDKIGGSYVPANVAIRVKYTNNGGSSKNFYAMIEYLY